MVDSINGAAADERQGACKLAFGARKRRNQPCRHHDVVGSRRQVEQSAIDVEKKSDRSVS
jgi:hypothetical protein